MTGKAEPTDWTAKQIAARLLIDGLDEVIEQGYKRLRFKPKWEHWCEINHHLDDLSQSFWERLDNLLPSHFVGVDEITSVTSRGHRKERNSRWKEYEAWKPASRE